MTSALITLAIAAAPALTAWHPSTVGQAGLARPMLARRDIPAQAPVSSVLNTRVAPVVIQPPEKKPTAKTPGWFEWKGRPSFRVGNFLTLEPEAKIQADLQSSYEGADVQASLDTFRLRRSRIGVQGEFLGHIEFEVEREMHNPPLTLDEVLQGKVLKSPWKDVYADFDYINRAQIRAGKFKIPFGLDELTGITRNDFVNRSLGAEYLAPARDIGIMAHGRFFNRRMNYWAGVFQHDGDNARAKTILGGDGTVAARLTAAPLMRGSERHLGSLEIGGAATLSDISNDSFRPNGLRGRTVLTEESFFSPVYVNGRRFRWEADLDWMFGPASLRAEYTHVTDDRLGQGLSGEDLPDAQYQSWYVAGTLLITGEKKVRPIKPRDDLFRGGAGAVELAARYEVVRYDSAGEGTGEPFRNPRAATILPSGDTVVSLGINWILNRWLTVQANAIRERITDEERSPVPNGAAFWSQVLRFQFAL